MKINMKTSISFDFYKLANFINTKKYDDLKTNALAQPMVEEYKKFIRSGKVKTDTGGGLADATKAARKARKSPPSIGGNKPLYDTGRLVNSIRYNKNKKGIYAIDYALGHIEGTHLDWNKKKVPARDFIDQTHRALSGKSVSASGKIGMSGMEKSQSSGMGKLIGAIRRVFSRRLAK